MQPSVWTHFGSNNLPGNVGLDMVHEICRFWRGATARFLVNCSALMQEGFAPVFDLLKYKIKLAVKHKEGLNKKFINI